MASVTFKTKVKNMAYVVVFNVSADICDGSVDSILVVIIIK